MRTGSAAVSTSRALPRVTRVTGSTVTSWGLFSLNPHSTHERASVVISTTSRSIALHCGQIAPAIKRGLIGALGGMSFVIVFRRGVVYGLNQWRLACQC